MRTLKAGDIAPFTKILAKMELKETIKAMFVNVTKDNSETNKGQMTSELIWGFIENYHKAEQDLFTFIADLEGKTKEEISDLPLNDFIDLIKELFNEKNITFFKSAVR